MTKADLKLDWCSHDAAKYAVEKWHYSRAMPHSRLVKLGAWESGRFVGAIVFGYGATPELGKLFGVPAIQVAELVRVALRDHRAPVSRMVAVALRMLKKQSPKLRLVVSFADAARGHHGGIYQAGNWAYLGAQETHAYRVRGRLVHPRTLGSRYGVGGQSVPWLRAHVDPAAERVAAGVKHKYVMPLDGEVRLRVEPLRRPYPKRAAGVAGDTPANHAGEGGSTPTAALSRRPDGPA